MGILTHLYMVNVVASWPFEYCHQVAGAAVYGQEHPARRSYVGLGLPRALAGHGARSLSWQLCHCFRVKAGVGRRVATHLTSRDWDADSKGAHWSWAFSRSLKISVCPSRVGIKGLKSHVFYWIPICPCSIPWIGLVPTQWVMSGLV